MKKMLIITLVTIALLSCAIPGMNDQETGATALSIQLDSSTSRTLLPSESMDVASYHVTVTASDLEVVYDETVSDSIVITGILPDTYTILVVGLNDVATAIGEGSGSATVTIGQTAIANITVAEYTGLGTLDLTTNWTPGTVGDPHITSTIAFGSAVAEDMTWTMGTDSASFFDDSMSNGWYTIQYKLYDNGSPSPSAGFATLARVAKDQTTTGTIDLIPNASLGDLQILVDLDFQDTLPVTVDVPEVNGNLAGSASPFTITASVDPSYGAIVYAWYLNGTAIETGDALTIDPSTLSEGNHYRYDLLAISSDGVHGASLTWEYDIVNAPVTFNWNPITYTSTDIQIAIFLDGETETGIVVPNTGTYDYYGIPVGMYSMRLRDTVDTSNYDYYGTGIEDTYLLGSSAVTFNF